MLKMEKASLMKNLRNKKYYKNFMNSEVKKNLKSIKSRTNSLIKIYRFNLTLIDYNQLIPNSQMNSNLIVNYVQREMMGYNADRNIVSKYLHAKDVKLGKMDKPVV